MTAGLITKLSSPTKIAASAIFEICDAAYSYILLRVTASCFYFDDLPHDE
jgi:hypothetical protein